MFTHLCENRPMAFVGIIFSYSPKMLLKKQLQNEERKKAPEEMSRRSDATRGVVVSSPTQTIYQHKA